MSFSKKISFFVAGFLLLLLDQLTKYWTATNLPISGRFSPWYPYGGIPVFKDIFGIEFSINHTINHGAAWGVLANLQGPLLVLRIVMIAGLIAYVLRYNRHKTWEIPLLLIIVGALGNVLDTLIYGHVVDMFHFVLWGYDFPVFNVADSYISMAVIVLFGLSLTNEKVQSKI